MLGDWPHEEIVKDIQTIMGIEKRDVRMPKDRLAGCVALHEVVARELSLPAVELPSLRDDLLEGVLRSAVDMGRRAGDVDIESASELLGFTSRSDEEIEGLLAAASDSGLMPKDKAKGYKSKAVRLYLAGLHEVPPVGVRTARSRQNAAWSQAVAAALHGYLDKNIDEARQVAIGLGVELQGEKLGSGVSSGRADSSVVAHGERSPGLNGERTSVAAGRSRRRISRVNLTRIRHTRGFRKARPPLKMTLLAGYFLAFIVLLTASLPNSTVVPEVSAKSTSQDDLAIDAGVANVTRGDTSYSSNVHAKVDDVVKVQMTYKNNNLDKRLRDFAPSFLFPGGTGKEQKIDVAGKVLDGSRQSSVTVHASIDEAALEYVAGSAKWRRNVAASHEEPIYETTALSDSVVGASPQSISNVESGKYGGGSVTVLARVVAKAVKVKAYGKTDKTVEWNDNVAAGLGGIVDVRVEVENKGNRPLKDLLVHCNLSPSTSLVDSPLLVRLDGRPSQRLPGSFARTPDENDGAGDEKVNVGVQAGELSVGEKLYIDYRIVLDGSLPVGSIVYPVSVVRPLEMNEFYNTIRIAIVK